jgi:hypothetical protein
VVRAAKQRRAVKVHAVFPALSVEMMSRPLLLFTEAIEQEIVLESSLHISSVAASQCAFIYADKLGLAPDIFMNTQPTSDNINMDLASCLATPPEFQEPPENRLLRYSSALSSEQRNSRECVR